MQSHLRSLPFVVTIGSEHTPICKALAHGFKVLVLGDNLFEVADGNLSNDLKKICTHLTKYQRTQQICEPANAPTSQVVRQKEQE